LIATSTSLTTTISSSDWAFNVSITLMPTYFEDEEGGWKGKGEKVKVEVKGRLKGCWGGRGGGTEGSEWKGEKNR
jgi:hypothetical protein